MTIPSTQIAAAIPPSGPDGSLTVTISKTHPVPKPGDGEVLVKLEYSGVCHSDVHSIRGDTPMLTDVAGHEGVGKVVSGEEDIADENMDVNVPGTFQQYIVTPAVHATKIPAELSPDTAAPLLCAGIAMYSSIKKTKARPGDFIVILGAGGGLGHMGVQIAAKKGLGVLAIDSGEKKRKLCLELGASQFLDFRQVDIVEAVQKATSGLGAHAVICTANGEKAYEQSMQMLRRLGTLVCVGIPNSPFRLPATPFEMIVKGLTIIGNSAGSKEEMNELMEMAVAGDIMARIDVYDLEDIVDVLKRLENSEIEGRVVLRIPE
ncbi:Alcohol dehydrogenase 1 [Penicillium diatomitis]|uniref:Alcohol dehydrogenase 1 n=1 Tax=Penicillium diatomitis TaxID=2819901 RepID=A0A9X0BU70_9EURO|nr:Alcohol dehydrogenase 1 [Penicillium diatomitis]KAJ5484000.1 Alcohol dehydrogenase 1 [Penicillium diatomitis]